MIPLYNAWYTPDGVDENGKVRPCRPLGLEMSQNRIAVPTWSYAMELVPPARILELGSAGGGFITALAVHAHQIGARVVTYDVCQPNVRLNDPQTGLARFLGVEFVVGDLWKAEAKIANLIRSPGTTYVLCDGGDKPRELATFAAYLKPGDVIAAHDYVPDDGPQGDKVWWPCGEIKLEQGAAAAAKFGLEPFLQPYFDMAAWLAYRRPISG